MRVWLSGAIVAVAKGLLAFAVGGLKGGSVRLDKKAAVTDTKAAAKSVAFERRAARLEAEHKARMRTMAKSADAASAKAVDLLREAEKVAEAVKIL